MIFTLLEVHFDFSPLTRDNFEAEFGVSGGDDDEDDDDDDNDDEDEDEDKIKVAIGLID